MKTNLEKSQKTFLIITGAAALFCALLMLPMIRNSILSFGERFILQRNYNHPEKIVRYMNVFSFGSFFGFMLLDFLVFFRMEEKFESFIAEKGKVISITLIALYTVSAVLIDFASHDIWYDEAFTISLCTHSFSEVISLTAQDVHPPLYYLIFKSFTLIFGSSIYVMRICSTLPVIIFMIIGGRFLCKEFSQKAAAIFELFIFSSVHLLKYSHELRMYSWAVLFCGMCGILSYYILRRNKLSDWVSYVLSAVLAAYTQYFAAVIVLCNFIPVCIFKLLKDSASRKLVFTSCGLGIILYTPWIPTVIAQFTKVSGSYWISQPDFITFLDWLKILCPGSGFFGYAGILFMFALLCILICAHNKSFWQILCAFSPLVQIFIGLSLSIIIRPIFVSRYALPGFSLICLSACLIVSNLRDSKIFMSVALILFGFSLMAVRSNFRSEKESSKNYEEFISTIAPKITKDTKIILIENEKNKFTVHQRGIWAALFPNHEIYMGNTESEISDDQWAYLFNSEFLSLKSLENNRYQEGSVCIIMPDSAPNIAQVKFIDKLPGYEAWQEHDFVRVSPSHYEKYRVYFF